MFFSYCKLVVQLNSLKSILSTRFFFHKVSQEHFSGKLLRNRVNIESGEGAHWLQFHNIRCLVWFPQRSENGFKIYHRFYSLRNDPMIQYIYETFLNC